MCNYLVSVIIPTYKRSDMVDASITSILKQTYSNVEIIVVDDNDPDTEWRKKTESKMNKYSLDSRIKYIKHNKNMNGSVARNTGIANSSGELVAFLDDDDMFYPSKIEKQVEFLIKNPQFRAVYCGWLRDDQCTVSYHEGDLSFDILSGCNIIYTNAIMMWKEDAIMCGGWDVTFKRHQEAAFLLRFFREGGKIGVVPEVLVSFDTSDRSNEAKNSIVYEEQMDHLLNSFESLIDECERSKKGAKKFIFCNRYRGVLFAHVKNKNIKSAVSLYLRMILRYPLAYNINIIYYIINRLFRSK